MNIKTSSDTCWSSFNVDGRSRIANCAMLVAARTAVPGLCEPAEDVHDHVCVPVRIEEADVRAGSGENQVGYGLARHEVQVRREWRGLEQVVRKHGEVSRFRWLDYRHIE